LHLYDVNILMVPSLSFRLECFLPVMAAIGLSCSFCIFFGGFGSSGMLIGMLISGNGIWVKFWLI
jgi:hypothetical protein